MSGHARNGTARPGGQLPGRAALCALLLCTAGVPVHVEAQEPGWTSPVWEQMPLVPNYTNQGAYHLGFLPVEDGADPSLDTLIVFHNVGTLRYAPGEDNGATGVWRRYTNARARDALFTSDRTLLSYFASPVSRSTDGGRTWHDTNPPYDPIRETRLPWLRAQSGGRAVILATGGAAPTYQQEAHFISFADGEPGSWVQGGVVTVFGTDIADVPPSPALPNGRLLHSGQYQLYSDDGAMSWHRVSMDGDMTGWYRNFKFSFLPRDGHPYGGIMFALGCGEHVWCDSGGNGSGDVAQLWRSDDGGTSFRFVHQFTQAETGISVDGLGPQRGVPIVGPDCALWAGISRSQGPLNPGRIMRSVDEGQTWHHADAGFGQANQGRGWRVHQLVVARDGRMYAATDHGVWRSKAPVTVAAEDRPPPPPELTITVAPNPSRERVTLTVTAPEAVERAMVDAFTSNGRFIVPVHDGPLPAGEHRFDVETRGWAAGMYFVRVYNGGRQDTQILTVIR